jgi:hypothetical protein
LICVPHFLSQAADITLSSDSVLEHLFDFMRTLISAQAVYGSCCIRVLVSVLRDTPTAARQRINAAQMAELYESVNLSQRVQTVQQYVCDTLNSILDIAPILSHTFTTIMRERFPHKRFCSKVQVSYVRCILTLCLRQPDLVPSVMATLFEKLVQIDAEIHEEDEEEEDDAQHSSARHAQGDDDVGSANSNSMLGDEMFQVEIDTQSAQPHQLGSMHVGSYLDSDLPSGNELSESEHSGSDDDSDDGGDAVREEGEEAQQDTQPRVIMDNLMLLMFEFVKLHMAERNETSVTLFEILWAEFARVVLPTFRSKYLQFLLFFSARLVILSTLARLCQPSLMSLVLLVTCMHANLRHSRCLLGVHPLSPTDCSFAPDFSVAFLQRLMHKVLLFLIPCLFV